ncbi:MAG: TIR domain-containing protein [Polyangiaceae bacterium]
MNLDGARDELAARVDSFVFAVDEWKVTSGTRNKVATETVARTRLEDVLTALLHCFDPLIKLGALNFKGRQGFASNIAAFRADGRHVDLVRDDYGLNFTNQSPGGLLSPRDVIDRVEAVDEIFVTLARRLEKLIHDQKVADRPELRGAIRDLAAHAAKLQGPCLALREGVPHRGQLTPVRPSGDAGGSVRKPVRYKLGARGQLFNDIAVAVKTSGWFPPYNDFRTEVNHKLLDEMETGAKARALLHSADGFYVWTLRGLRLMSDHAFMKDELVRAADLIDLMKNRYNAKQRDPVRIAELWKELGWTEPNEVRRATYVLCAEFPMALRYVAQSATDRVPEQLFVTEKIWKTSRELVLDGPPEVATPALVPAAEVPNPVPPPAREVPMSRNALVIHGHDEATKHQVVRALEALRLKPIVLHEQVNAGLTIIEKFERHAKDAVFAVAIISGDDEGRAKRQKAPAAKFQPRARQNVILEAGYCTAKLGRAKVFLLREDGVEQPSDWDGLLWVARDPAGAWRSRLAREIEDTGVVIEHDALKALLALT